MCGFLTGCVVFGQLADRIGRHKTLLIALMVEILFATGATFVPYYSAYVSLRFVVGAAAAGSFTTVFIMCKLIIRSAHLAPFVTTLLRYILIITQSLQALKWRGRVSD